MKKKTLYIICFLCFVVGGLSRSLAQNAPTFNPDLSNFRTKIISPGYHQYLIDSSSIFYNSLFINDINHQKIDTSKYEIDYLNGIITLDSSFVFDTLTVVYRVMPFNLAQDFSHKKPTLIKKDTFFFDPYYYQPSSATQDFLDFGGLNYSGDFSRGVSFGSNQDLVVNSAFNLHLSGKIGDDIEILAALTDNNIPLQPDGNTQQIQDFDKVYIQVTKGLHRLTAGDYEIRSDNSYFLKFNKQLQGASYQGGFDFKNQSMLRSNISLAVAKGKFVRNAFTGQENNQGPYKLTGSNGEVFLIILAGSEKVYVNGKLLQRGEEMDYVIDYNSGEITFTPNFLVTKDSRITIDFEYSDRNYFRSLIHTGHTYEIGKTKFSLDFYSEQDSKNKPVQQNLDDSTIAFLSGIGDDIENAYYPGVTQVSYDATRILYELRDSTVGADFYDSVFVYSTDSSLAKYSLSFSFLGQNKGNYNPAKNAANQRVYSWVAPVGGIPQGSYEPVILIITPKKDQYLTAGVEHKFSDKLSVRGDIGFSNKDFNTFSESGNGDNKGIAGHVQLQHGQLVGKDSSFQIKTNVQYEYKGRTFKPLEQYRPVEFTRDWNDAGTNDQKVDEHLASGNFFLGFKDKLQSGYTFTTFQKPSIYKGYSNRVFVNWHMSGWNVIANFNLLNTKTVSQKTSFSRPDIELSKNINLRKGFVLGSAFSQERNAIRFLASDSLATSSFYNNNYRAFFYTSDSGFIRLSGDYRFRNDLFSNGTEFKKGDQSHTIDLKGQFLRLKNQDLSWSFTLRDLTIKDTTLTKLEPEKTYLGRAEYGVRIKKGLIRFNTIYELGSGQERIKEFSFLEVQSGQGVYRWVDENLDGLQQQNEFVISEFSDSAKYIKVYTTLNEYIKARQVSYNQVLNINPKVVWFDSKGFKGFMARFQVQSFLELRRKTLEGAKNSPFNPFIFKSEDSTIVSLNTTTRQNILFNQTSTAFSANYSWQTNQDKILQVNGYDDRKRNFHVLNTRFGITDAFSGNIDFSVGKETYNSEFFITNNYLIKTYKIDPKLIYNFKTNLRISTGYGLSLKKNDPGLGGEKAFSNKLNFELRYSKAGKQSLESKFTFAKVNFTGTNGTTKAYLILEGLQPGQNYIWSLTYDRQLSKNLQLNVGYEGRKTGDAKVVNTGRAQLRATF